MVPTGFDAYYKVFNINYLLTHGDRLGSKGGAGIIGMLGPIARGVQKIKTEYSTQKKPVDYVLMGHWHQYLSLNGIIVNGSLKGYCEYAASNRFSYEVPKQALWFTHPKYGVTFQVPVMSELAVSSKNNRKWVQVCT